MLRHPKIPSEQRLGGRRSKTHNHLGPERRDFRLQPRAASGNFSRVRLFMDSAFAARLPFEMLYRIGNVDWFAIKSGLGKGRIE